MSRMPLAEIVLRYLYAHPWAVPVLILAVVGIFVLWVAAPITWRDGEGNIRESGEYTASWMSIWSRFFKS